jgi:SAM-dependent methyltransferase
VRESEYQTMLEENERHWWYRGRARIVRAVLAQLDLPPGGELLDAGCGAGTTLDELTRYGRAHGVELNPLGVRAARERGHADVREARVEELPFEDATFDCITCLDVIEHTPDDIRSLEELRRVAKPGAALVVTVPAYPRLWSQHDVVNHHYRRYTRRSLRRAAWQAGWGLEFDSHFNSVYLAPAALVRLLLKGDPEAERRSELALTPRSLDAVLEWPLRIEAALLRSGASLPMGFSLFAVLRAPGGPSRSAAARGLRAAAA